MKKMKDLPYIIGLKVKIYPSDEQKRLIAVNDGAKRAVYNHLVACGNEKYRLSMSADNVPAYQERLDYLESVTGGLDSIKNAMPFLYGKDVDDQAVANASKNYHTAWKNRKERHTGVPVFKKKSSVQSYQTNAHYYAKDTQEGHNSNVWFLGKNHVTLPKLGRIRFGGSPREVSEIIRRQEARDIRIGTITVERDAVGEYWASFQAGSETPFRETFPETGSKRGIDLNLLELVVDSDGNELENPKFLQASMKKLKKAQRRLSRMAERAKKDGRKLLECKNYQKQRQKVAYLHRKVARQRADYLHAYSKHEIESQDFIAAEDLKVKNLMRNHNLAKAIGDAGWRTLLNMLKYKAKLYGRTVVLVPPKDTTQTCSVCGYVMSGDEKLTLDVREWECPSCHTHHHRDRNAARNVLKRGLQAAMQPYP